jgi:peptidoglycan-N-acetylglucosamine deacetylase
MSTTEWPLVTRLLGLPHLVEISGNWYLDDLPPMMFIKASPNRHGFVNPRDVEQLWRD